MTYAPAITDLCVVYDNLSAAIDHYDTRNDLLLDQGRYLVSLM
jgi:hypothetical protein